jgi:hypothetical protein
LHVILELSIVKFNIVYSKIILSALIGLSLTPAATAATFFSPEFVNADVDSSSFTSTPGGGLVSNGGVFAFEIENATSTVWNNGGGGFTGTERVSGTYSFAVASGYQISSLRLGGGGFWAANDATVSVTATLNDDDSGLTESNTVSDCGCFANSAGIWKLITPIMSYAPGLNSVQGSFTFDFSASPNNASALGFGNIYGANNAETTFPSTGSAGELYRGPTLYVTLEQVSAVPEPAEWAMMLAGLALVGRLTRKSSQARPNSTSSD